MSFLAINIDKASDINSSDGIMANGRGVEADGTQNGQSSSCCDRSGTRGANNNSVLGRRVKGGGGKSFIRDDGGRGANGENGANLNGVTALMPTALIEMEVIVP